MDFIDTVQAMAESLTEAAVKEGVDLRGLTYDNFNTFLDDAFNDGGEARCVEFVDLADDFALGFGELESDEFTNVQHECIEAAIEKVQDMWKNAHYKWSNPFDWLKQSGLDTWDFLVSTVSADDVQDYFQDDMEKDGYFSFVTEEV